VDAEIERIVASSGAQAPHIKQLFESPGGREAIERSLLSRKTLDRLIEIVSAKKAAGKAAAKATAAGAKKPAARAGARPPGRKRKAKAVETEETK
jgi:hypothetical protein